jgi:glycogen synthase
MNILMFGWEFPPNITGGLGTACYGITRGLREIGGVNVTLALPKLHYNEDQTFVKIVELPRWDKDAPHETTATPGSELRSAYSKGMQYAVTEYAAKAQALITQHLHFDVIHAHDWLTVAAGEIVKKISGKPLLLHIHSTEYDRAGDNPNADIVAIERRGMDVADAIIAVSNFTRDIIVKRYGQDPNKIITIYNATEPGSGLRRSKSRGSPIMVTFVGRITHQKGPAYFVEAAYKSLQQLPELRFVMAGDGDLLQEVKVLAENLGIGAQISFPGFLQADEVRHLLSQTDVYVMPSVSEPFGIAALEAIDAEIPAILSNTSGVIELFANVVKIDYWDTDAIASSIVRIANDAPFAEQLRNNAKLEIKQIQWTASAEKLKKAYWDLIHGSLLGAVSDKAAKSVCDTAISVATS